MKFYKFMICLCVGVVLLSTCNKDDSDIAGIDLSEESHTDEEVAFFDEQEEDFVDIEEITLPNGENIVDFISEYDPGFFSDFKSANTITDEIGPQTLKNLTIAKMQVKAHYLVDDANFQYAGNIEMGFPPQDGLAYSFGSKDYTKLQVPPAGECKGDDLYGLDCSGFVYLLFKSAGIDIPVGTANLQRKPETLNNAIKDKEEFKKIKFEDLGQIPTGDIETGDIIYWIKGSRVPHIGMVLKTARNKIRIYQSNGTSKVSGDCAANYSKRRGPRIIKLSNYNWFSTNYGIVRMVTDISGDWTAFLRCEGQTGDALALAFTIPVLEGGSFSANGNGTDYTGDPITAILEGEYNQQTNTISGVFTLTFPENPDDIRKDGFEVRLDKDETEYFVMDKVLDNTGCVLEMKLRNNETTTKSTHSSNSNLDRSNITVGKQ